MAIIREARRERYSVINNQILENHQISYRARGLLSYMLSKPDNWKFYVSNLADNSDVEGEKAVSSALKELEAAGYLERKVKRDKKGHYKGLDYILRENPKKEQDQTQSDEETTPQQTSVVKESSISDPEQQNQPETAGKYESIPTEDKNFPNSHSRQQENPHTVSPIAPTRKRGSRSSAKGGLLITDHNQLLIKVNTDDHDHSEPGIDGSNPFDLADDLGINVRSGYNMPVFVNYIQRMGKPLVCYAVKQTGKAKKPNWNYLLKVFKTLEDNKVKTVEQAEKLSSEYKQKRKSKYQKVRSRSFSDHSLSNNGDDNWQWRKDNPEQLAKEEQLAEKNLDKNYDFGEL